MKKNAKEIGWEIVYLDVRVTHVFIGKTFYECAYEECQFH
jgi:hypothetical protein